MGWIKWVGGGIAASLMAGAILLGVFATGGGASAEEGSEDDDGPAWGSFAALPFDEELGFAEGGVEVMALAGPAADEWKALVAEKLGVTVEELETAMSEARTELGLPEPGEGRPFRRGAVFGWHLHGALDVAAEIIGIEPSEVIEGLRDDKTLAQIAEENGVGRADLKAGIIAAVTEKVNEAVANERITQERADEIIANLDERIEALLDRVQELRELRSERNAQ